MKNIIFTSLLLFFAFGKEANSQSFSNAQSVEYDSANNRYLVSNSTTKQIIAREANGTLSLLATLPFAPLGIEILGDTLYCCTPSAIYAIDKNTGAPFFNVTIAANAFLDGITHDPQGNLYITASANYFKKVYKFNTANRHFNIFVNNTVTNPNGIIYDPYDGINPRLLVVFNGANAAIKSINIADSSLTTLVTTSFSNINGIAKGKNGQFYVSVWSNNSIQRYDSTFTGGPTAMVTSGLLYPTDIYYNFNSDTLAVPADTMLNFYYFGSVTNQNKLNPDDQISIYPNPSHGEININGINHESDHLNIKLTEIASGKLVINKNYASFGNNSIRLEYGNITSGMYLMEISSAEGYVSRKKLIIE